MRPRHGTKAIDTMATICHCVAVSGYASICLCWVQKKNRSFHKAAFHLPKQEFHSVDSTGFVSQLSVSEGPRVTTAITTLL